MRKILLAMAIAVAFLASHAPTQAMIVTPTNDPNLLATTILGNGVTLVSSSYVGAVDSSGTFTGAMSAIGINSGILLTNGQATLAMGPNNQSGAGRDNGLPGTPQLDALSGGPTFDASVLNLVFSTNTNSLFFNFVFASEEYNQFVGSFNDVFGFFLDGSNIALLPGNIPVSINNVNLNTNSNLYINNSVTPGADGPVVPDPRDTQYDGFTTVLTAQATGLSPGDHTISIQIADALDHVLDSGVFIQAGSFSGTPPPSSVPEPGTMLLMGLGVFGAACVSRRAKNA